MDIFDCANVQTSCRLHRNEQIVRSVEFSCNDCFLLVAARHAARFRNRTLSASYVEFVDKSFGIFSQLVEFDKTALLELRCEITLKHHVLFKRVVEHKTVFVAIFWNMAHSVCVAMSYILFGDIFAV